MVICTENNLHLIEIKKFINNEFMGDDALTNTKFDKSIPIIQDKYSSSLFYLNDSDIPHCLDWFDSQVKSANEGTNSSFLEPIKNEDKAAGRYWSMIHIIMNKYPSKIA